MTAPIADRELLAIRARVMRAQDGLHQSLRQTEADRLALMYEMYRLREELALHTDCRTDVSIGDALRLIRGAESNAEGFSGASAGVEASGGTQEAQEGSR